MHLYQTQKVGSPDLYMSTIKNGVINVTNKPAKN